LNPFIAEVQQKFGRQPFFIYDLDAMKTHLDQFKIPGVKFWYATKANPLSAVLKTAYVSGFAIDCASAGEFRQAIRAGVPTSEILLTGPSKSKKLIAEALEAGIKTFVLESVQQALDLETIAKTMNLKVDALLRLQLTWKENESSVLGGSKITPFGLDAEGWIALDLQKLKSIRIKGIHCFQWGNILSADRLAQIWAKTAKEAQLLAKNLGISLQVLDLGGGIGIPYHSETELAFSEVKTALLRLKQELPQTEIWMELGRYAIGPFGKYVCDIVDKKTVQGKNFLVLEGGVHHLVRPALVGEAFPVTPLKSTSHASPALFEVHGPLCTALDHLGSFHLPSEIEVGESLVFHQCGAYGFTESMPFFLCHDLPAEFVIQNKKLACLRQWAAPEGWLV
jgi:diaminopimelate decarboxylase